jgi:hypothetical protein
MWEAVERSPGVYNETYLDEVEKLINRLGKKGIYTQVDAHQDILARIVCGEGMPNFYAKEILEKRPIFCMAPKSEALLAKFGLWSCRTMATYNNLEREKDGTPTIKSC